MKIRITFKPVVCLSDKEIEAETWNFDGGLIVFRSLKRGDKVVAAYDLWAILGFEVIDEG